MKPIDRILACTAWLFGLAPPRPRREPDSDAGLDRGALEAAALECCAAEGLGAEELMREVHDRSAR